MNTTPYPYQTPGVHVQDVPPAPGPIQGASTSVAAFVGVTRRGPDVGAVSPLSSYRQFLTLFGDDDGKLPADDPGLEYLAYGVYGFFNNGGARCYVTRLSPKKPSIAQTKAADKDWQKLAAGAVSGRLAEEGVSALSASQQSSLDKLIADFRALSNQQAKDALKSFLASLNWKSVGKDAAKVVARLVNALMTLLADLQKAQNRAAAFLLENDITQALAALEPYDDISIVAAPGLTDENQWRALITHCTTNAPNCFAILDSPAEADWANTPPPLKDVVLPSDSDYAAIYYPWIKVANPTGGEDLTVPPSGHIAGVYARVDAQRGVFKAPANESIYGAIDLPVYVSAKQQGPLNVGEDVNVNCIRRLNGGILIWGARTVPPPDPNNLFTYVSTRRTFNYIRQSLENGMQWAVFEPNTQALWGQIVRNVTSFLTTLWQDGGLFGSTAAEAFYVKCDADTNPPDVRASGQVVTEVGVAITQPAEFVVFQLGLTSGSATPTTGS